MPPNAKACAWELFAGAPHERPPLTATAAEVKVTKLTRWSRGWGPLEVLALCEALGNLTCVAAMPGVADARAARRVRRVRVGRPRDERGRRAPRGRAAGVQVPGRPSARWCRSGTSSAPVLLANATAGKPFGFAEQAAAMEARATALGFGGALRYVAGRSARARVRAPSAPDGVISRARCSDARARQARIPRLTYHDEKCAGSPGDTRRLLDALAQQPPAGGGGGAPRARARGSTST